SPVNHISAAAPPFLVIHGEQDTVVPIAETEDFFNKMRQAGADIAFRRVAAGHHWLTFYDTNAAAKAAVLHFLDRTIGQKRVAARAE
ncbi:MAG TPA: prolyl oligopeptidase family serine peptidase, partial [Bryobacteraceae bacterium]|nr:prolyl oligopeptidase family serine peptidase [Bryobacteraceae bacterium]